MGRDVEKAESEEDLEKKRKEKDEEVKAAKKRQGNKETKEANIWTFELRKETEEPWNKKN